MTAFIDTLLARRSAKLAALHAPGPNRKELETILTAASRVPDHGKLCPWYFIVFEGENREKAGEILKKAWKAENPEAKPAKLDLEAERFLKAPTVIAVVSRFREGKHPLWEQILSAGAACFNLCLAANALGFATNWLTQWYSYNETFKKELGLDERDHIAGIIYIGSTDDKREDRERPELVDLVTWWEPGIKLNKGDRYGKSGKGLPEAGFKLPRTK